MFADRHRIHGRIALGLLAVLATGAAAEARTASVPVAASSAEHASAAPAAAPSLPAAAAPSSSVSATADELTRLQDLTMVLQARLKELEAQQAVDARLEALRGSAAPSLGNVRVVAVEQMGATRLATVRLNDGSEFEVAPGDTLVDGTRVTAIENGVVTVRLHGGQVARLRVGAGQGAPGMASGGAVPPVPANGPMMIPPFRPKPE